MEKLFHQKKLLGVHVKRMQDGSTPVSDADEPLQLLTLKHPRGAQIRAHAHKSVERVTTQLQECLVVVKGSIRVALYADGTEPVREVDVKEGEAFLFVSGGHGVTFLEDAEVFEIKNGPFREDKVLL